MNLFHRSVTDVSPEKEEVSETENLVKSDISTEQQTNNEPPILDAFKSGKSESAVDSTYGIGDVAKLVQSLPKKNIDNEIAVVVRTIASFNVDVNSIIEDANKKQQLAKSRLELLSKEIEELQGKISARNQEIDLLRVGLSEIEKSQEYLARGIDLVNKENQNKSIEKNNKASAPPKKKRTRKKKSSVVSKEVEMAKTTEFNVINLDVRPEKAKRKTRKHGKPA